MKKYSLKFIKLSRYALEMVKDMRQRMRRFVSGLGRHMQKKCKAILLIHGMDISRIMMYAQQTEKDNKRDREEYLSRKAKSVGHEPARRDRLRLTSPISRRDYLILRSLQ